MSLEAAILEKAGQELDALHCESRKNEQLEIRGQPSSRGC